MSHGEFDIAVSWLSGSVFDPVDTYHPFEIKNTKPVGQDASSGGNYVRARYKDLDSLANQLENVDPQDPKALMLFNQALEAFYKNLPYVPIYQQTFPIVFNTTYWTGWPTNDDLYEVPSYGWGQFIFVIGNLKPTGAS
jgi:peptide/nickel transport system substrate-binding protein